MDRLSLEEMGKLTGSSCRRCKENRQKQRETEEKEDGWGVGKLRLSICREFEFAHTVNFFSR